ncbi:MAG: hypothetical protein M1827_003877 [Pycnora praestabilis]|nr:MAG: hypothetical protein M1827_003877 [Pycnora praestabilis]
MDIDPRLRSNGTSNAQTLYGLAPAPSFPRNTVHLPPPNPSSDLSPLNPSDSSKQPYYHIPSPYQPHQGSSDHAQPHHPPIGVNDASSGDPKRPRACEACRGLKVRCEPDPKISEGACRRCAKAGRQCVVTAPSRKRQKKTDSRVAELEKKIDALTATLHATRSTRHDSESDESSQCDGDAPEGPLGEADEKQRGEAFTSESSGWLRQSDNDRGRTTLEGSFQDPTPERLAETPNGHLTRSTLPTLVGQKRRHSDNFSGRSTVELGGAITSPLTVKVSTEKSSDPANMYPFLMPKVPKPRTGSVPTPTESAASSQNANAEYTDVIDRRLIDSVLAAEIFERYKIDMAPHFPAVVFPPGTSAAEVRKTKPILFLAILSAGGPPDIQRVLTKEVMRVYADRIICNGEKTLELIQALTVSTLWYWPAEHYEELKFYQLIHIAAVMAMDVGLGKKAKPCKQKQVTAGLLRDHPWRRAPYPSPDTIEARRAWLSCYWMSANVSMALRRPNLIRWTPYMAECVEVLETSVDAFESDNFLCQWIRVQHIAEEIGIQFSMDDPFAVVTISDPKVQYALKGFERQLEEWRLQIPKVADTPTLRLCEHVITLYMHEIALHVDHNVEDFKPPFTEDAMKELGQQNQPELLNSAHVGALAVCLTSIHRIFDGYLSFNVLTTRTLPIFHYVRVSYAMVVLIKMYFAATTPNSELGKVIRKEDMKVEHYLDSLVASFKASGGNEKARPASKFLMVFVMLKTWFSKDGKPGFRREAPSGRMGTLFDESMCQTLESFKKEASETSNNPLQIPRQGHGYPHILSKATDPSGSSDGLNIEGERTRFSRGYSAGAHTPLELLSQVAMGDSHRMVDEARTSAAQGQTPSSSWYNFNGTEGTPSGEYSMGPPPVQTSFPVEEQRQTAGSNAAAPDMVFDDYLGGGFEQAMGLTLGDGDLSSFFMNDGGMFNITMDGSPNVFDAW